MTSMFENKKIYTKERLLFDKTHIYVHKKQSDFYTTLYENYSTAPVVVKMTRTIFYLDQHSCRLFLFLAWVVYTFTLASFSAATCAILSHLHFVTFMTAAMPLLPMTKADLDMTLNLLIPW